MIDSEELRKTKRRLALAEARVAELQTLNDKLRENEVQNRWLIGSLAEVVWETNAEGFVTAASPSSHGYTGRKPHELLGHSWLDAIHLDDRAYADLQWRRAVATRGPVNIEVRVRTPDGEWRWTKVHAVPLSSSSGDIAKWAGMNIDIDERKRAQTALRESEERYRRLFHTIEQGYGLFRIVRDEIGQATDLILVDLNLAYERMLGIKAEDARGRRVRGLFPDSESWSLDAYDRIVRVGAPERIEHKASASWFEAAVYPQDQDSFIALIDNITTRKRAEEAQRESEQRLLATFASVPVAIAEFDLEGKAGLCNTELRRFLPNGLMPSRDPKRSHHWQAWDAAGNLIPLKDYPSARALRGESVVPGMEMLYTDDSGGEFWTDVATTPICDGTGQVTGCIAVINDVTERKKVEKALRRDEERQAFFLKLSDTIRLLSDPADIQGEVTRRLREKLNAGWCSYVGWDLDRRTGRVLRDATRNGLASLVGEHDVADSPDFLQLLLEGGQVLAVRDYASYEELSERTRRNFISLGFGSMMVAPLVKEGRLIASLLVGDTVSRDWSPSEMSLLAESAERTWSAVERSRAEAALRESQQDLHGVANITPDLLWYSEPDGSSPWFNARYLEYTGQSLEQATGWGWLEAIHPDDRETSAQRYRKAVEQSQSLRQEHRVRRHTGEYRWFLVRCEPVRDEHGHVVRMYGAATDIQDQRDAMAALRESEERLAHDLKATQILQDIGNRLISKPGANGHFYAICEAALALMRSDCASIQTYDEASARLKLAEHIGFDPESAAFWDWVDAGFGTPCGRALDEGERVIVPDINLFNAEPSELAAFRQSAILSVQSTPLVARTGQIVGMMSTHWKRKDAPAETSYQFFDILARLAADFIVRIRSEAALRESEQRFQQFANASAAGIWVRHAGTLEMEFLSPALARMCGVQVQTLLGDVKHLASLIVPDDREAALQHLDMARNGQSVAHEFRIRRPSDGAFRWIRDTVFPLRDGEKIPRIGGIAEDVSDTKLAAEHQAILLAELQHRVRNILAMSRSLVQRTARSARDVNEFAALISGRLMSLARTQALLTRAANVAVDLQSLLHTELSAQADDDSQYTLSGPQVQLSPKAAQVLALAIHELATNALKYGAFATAQGKIDVVWRVSLEQERPLLRLQWTETRPAVANWAPPTRRGFGTELVEQRVPYELDGQGKVELTAEGATVSIAFPLETGASILATSAPIRKSVLGGSIDMSREQVLAGLRILVVEDDYLLAWDLQSTLESAGAMVVGPAKKAGEAIAAIRGGDLNAALTDINLGDGPSFEIAECLQQMQIPFAFITGYDQTAIPRQFAGVPAFSKPIDSAHMVRAFAQSLQTTRSRQAN